MTQQNYKSILLKSTCWCSKTDCIKQLKKDSIAVENIHSGKIICQSCFSKISKESELMGIK